MTPAVNQVELHPRFIQRELREAHARLGIVTQAWSPLGGSVRRASGTSEICDSLEHPTVVGLAAKYGKTPAQVLLRWHIDHGFSAIPKSFRSERIAKNFDIFDFALSTGDIAAIDALDTGRRSGADPEVMSADASPIKIDAPSVDVSAESVGAQSALSSKSQRLPINVGLSIYHGRSAFQ